MTVSYWFIPKADLDLEAGNTAGGFDADGVHSCCRQYGNYASCRKTPVASLDLGAVTDVVLKCDAGEDLTVQYPNAVEKTHAATLTELGVEANHWFDPAITP